MVQIIDADDVASFTSGMSGADVKVLVDGLNAKAARVAPCLADNPSADVLAEARLILIGALKRWAESGSGAFSQQSLGAASVSIDTRQRNGGYNLWPSEIGALQDLCAATNDSFGRAFSVRPTSGTGVASHWPWCDLCMYGLSCSCGASLTGSEPLYEAP